MRRILTTVAFVLAIVAALPAADAVGTLRKVDAENGVLFIHIGGQDRSITLDRDVTVIGADGQPLAGGLRAEELKAGTEVTVSIEVRADTLVVTRIRLGKHGALESKPSVGLKPLTDMTADDKYKGEDGGL